MPYRQIGALRAFYFDLFPGNEVDQSIFTRQGGVSPEPWNSLNVGGTNGDERARVVQNRKLLFDAFGYPVDSLFDVWQVHGTDVVFTEQPRPLDSPHRQADIIVTNQPGIVLFMRFGDCVPILLYDPVKKVIAMAHAGWQGTVKKAASVAVHAMCGRYGSKEADILAGIGPSVGAHHYEVGSNVIQAVQGAFGSDSSGLLNHQDGRVTFDLWEANRLALEQSGVRRIEVSGVCTVCDTRDWFSHRGDKGKTGRFGAVMVLKNNSRNG